MTASTGSSPSTITATARDEYGNPVSGATVVLAATGTGNSVVQPSSVTDATGVATGTLSSTAAGAKIVSAKVAETVLGSDTVQVVAGPPGRIAIQAGNQQRASVATAVAIPPAVLVEDALGNPVDRVPVTFVVTSGGGAITGGSVVATAATGIAAVAGWTLGPTAGTNTMTARAAGSDIVGNPVTFAAIGELGHWTRVANLPTRRYVLGAAAVNGRLYALGGLDEEDYRATVEAYDPATNTWTPGTPMPAPRAQFGIGVIDGVIYVVGGVTRGSGDSTVVATVEAYNPATRTWSTRAPMPAPRADMAVAVVDGILYAIGGWVVPPPGDGPCAYTSVGTVEAYDPVTDTWTARASMPTARALLGAGTVNGIVYALGGQVVGPTPDEGTLFLATVEAYDPATDTWTARAPMPTRRFALGVGEIGGLVYAVGGDVAPLNPLHPTGTLEAYDPVTDRWTVHATMPTARAYLGTAVINGLLYAVGGHGALNVVEAYHR
ncbi:MAG TPA: kelch repeat-containing protein [Actinomycetota bacterium]|nr:kelch repeat-containing protein [Actinomycetota bacterium]